MAALFAATTGCVAASDDDDGDGVLNIDDFCPNTPPGASVDIDGCSIRTELGLITSRWSFKNVGSQTELGCPTGFNTTAVHAQPVDRFGRPAGQKIIDLFTCSNLMGTADYEARPYAVFMEITTNNNSAKYADTP